MDTKTIDQRIREKAKKEHQQKIEEQFKSIRSPHFNALRTGIDIESFRKDGDEFTGYNLLEMVQKSIVAQETEEAQNEAVAGFLEQFEQVKDDIDNIYDSTGI